MNYVNYLSGGDRDYLQSVLYRIATAFLFIYSLILSLSPAVRFHSWQVSFRWEHWFGFLVSVISFYFIDKISKKNLTNRDPYLLPTIGFLMGIGLLTIFRLNVVFGWRQSLWFFISTLMICIGLQKSDWLSKIRYYKYVWLFLGLALTALTFFLGIYPSGNGPQLWLSIGGIFLQPSEPLKILFIIYLSAYLAERWPNRNNIPVLIVPTLLIILSALLILVGQRDLGTASIFIFIYAFYMFLVTGKRRTLILFAGLLFIAGLVGYQSFNVIKIRVDSWINPWLDPGGNSYQIIQSIQAMAAGKLLGSGPGIGSPGLVPVALSDFIFSSITEELGLLGAGAIFCLYIFIFYRGFLISLKASNHYLQLLSAGITVLFAAQSILILGGNTRLLPLTGVTLPFISYGGSSLITSVFGVILLIWISNQSGSKNIPNNEIKPYIFTFKTIILGFTILSLVTGWWTIIRSDNLLSRQDNLRRIINDRYVKRGSILDRQNNPLAITVGNPGDYSRYITDASLSSTIGYINPIYGLGGIEYSMDDYLRGLAGLPSSTMIFSSILYSQPPTGLDLRTSIDSNIQNKLKENLKNFYGAGLVMNAETGEILGLWTSPTFDSNQLEAKWELWKSDPQSPLINRATQGYYPAGSLLSPFLLTYSGLERIENELKFNQCAVQSSIGITDPLAMSLQNGCQDLLDQSLEFLPESKIADFINTFGWTDVLNFELPQIEPIQPELVNKSDLSNDYFLSPLQIARAAAIFSQSGNLPYPRIAMAVNIPERGWVVLSSLESKKVIESENISAIVNRLARFNNPTWEFSSRTIDGDVDVSWYVSGTMPEWQGTPIVLVLVLEESKPEIAQFNGRKLLEEITTNPTEP